MVRQRDYFLSLMCRLRLVINLKKSELELSQSIKYVGGSIVSPDGRDGSDSRETGEDPCHGYGVAVR